MYCPKCGTQNDDGARFCKHCAQDLASTAPRPAADELGDVAEIDLVRQELDAEYEVLEELGRGGMAIVFRARERQLDREVAIKVLPFSLAFDKEFVERFQREARTAARLEHPNIIQIYRVGKSGRVIYFIMKLLRGKPLSEVLVARGSLPPADIRRTLVEVGRALAYAHRGNIVHRDIKPDNIMFDEHGHAVVTDFGIAKAASGGKLTGTGMAIGTPHYMSPEQARAQGIDGRSDLYSLGVVAYQCLTGALPFDGEDSFSIGYKHIMEEIPVPKLDSPEKRDLFEVVKKMMAKRPEERFQDADEMVAVLEGNGGFVATGITTAATRAVPALSTRRAATAGTTPLPSMTTSGRPVAMPSGESGPHKSALGGVLVWVLVVGSVLGGGTYFAYTQGLLRPFFPPAGAAGGPEGERVDSAAPRAGLDSVGATDTAAGGPHAADTSPAAPDTPGRLVLQNVPQGARVTIDGRAVRGTQLDLPPGTHRLGVEALGYRLYERQIAVLPGVSSALRVELELATGAPRGGGGGGGGPCDQYGPEYNRGNICFDTRPTPLSATVIPVGQDAAGFPRQAILLIHVSRDGATLEARIFVPSNLDTFNSQALDMAQTLRWNPAIKNGDPTDAWVQWPFQPVRQ